MIVVRFKLTCKPDRADEVMAAMKEVVAPSREIDGVLEFDIGRDLTDPNSFIATEVFEDMNALERQEAQPQVVRVMELVPDALVSPPEATIYRVSSSEPAG